MTDDPEPNYKTISELTQEIRDTLEGDFAQVTVCGEVSGFSAPRSGHWYLTLKDEEAQISAVVWRSTAQRVRFPVEDGTQVVVSGRLTVYPPRGSYQLVIDQIQPLGEGSWRAKFRRLYEKLALEGLFDAARKRPIPLLPRRVIVITSPSGAAVRDFLQIAQRRWRGSQIVILPTKVQGQGAGEQLAAAVGLANRLRPTADVIVVTRGGGSIEDLWEFNHEGLVRAIAASRIPVVSGVGHEIDVTLCDLVADLRALTPSEAAERIFPDQQTLIESLCDLQSRLVQSLRRRGVEVKQQVDRLANSRVLRRPLDLLLQHAQRLDERATRLVWLAENDHQRRGQKLQGIAGRLEALSPLQVLSRGYSVTVNREGKTVLDTEQIQIGDLVETRLHQGKLISLVQQKIRAGDDELETSGLGRHTRDSLDNCDGSADRKQS
ncbi:MAG: exodeoxyribonuclease VII large subunit [Planctomycetaceae bacterium]|nr:exodeoxyribonuclease VII large subunit [Planctomycetaceae bacterium]